MKKITADNPEMKPLLAVCGAFIFIMSSLHVPSVTGSSSHPTGNGLGAVFFGATVISAICVPILFFQALLLAHGGITTLGANVFSMGIVGPFCAVFVWKFGRKIGLGYSSSNIFSCICWRLDDICNRCNRTWNGISNTNL